MIRIEFSEKEDTEIELSGHACDELVCAAVSGLFYALLGYLKESGCVIKTFYAKSGKGKIAFSGGKEAVRMFAAGLRAIEKEHSDDIAIVK